MKRSIFLSLIYNVFSIVYQGFSFDFFLLLFFFVSLTYFLLHANVTMVRLLCI